MFHFEKFIIWKSVAYKEYIKKYINFVAVLYIKLKGLK